jgi:hypothetical protein
MNAETRLPARIRWLIASLPVVVLAGVAAVMLARGLPPRQQEGLINRLPEFVRPAVRSLILPVYPDIVPTPNALIGGDVSSLLTPLPTIRPTAAPTHQPADTPTIPPTEPLTPPPTGDVPSSTFTPPAVQPTLTPVVPPGPRQAARSTPAAVEDANVLLTGFKHIYQTWNNCGPATMSMNLSYYGWPGGQADAAKFLKPDAEDKNVSPHEMVAFAQSAGFNAIMRVNGSPVLLKQFLQARIPVLIEKGFEPDPKDGWEGHYELIVGYNDSRREFVAMDSYTGPNQSVTFDALDWYWSHFNRTFIIVYTGEQTDTVMQLLGADADPASNSAAALAAAQAQAAADPSNPFTWFNMGTNFAALGEYESAANAYDRARSLGLPWRMPWYQFGLFEAYYHTGRYDDVLTLADATLKITPYVEELWYYRGLVYQARGEINAAREQYRQALVYNPNFRLAADALANLGS